MKTIRKNIGAILLGLVVILVGIGYAAKAMGFDFNISSLLFDGWWTVFIIVPGLLMLFDKNSSKFFAVIVIAVGVLLLISRYIELNIRSWIVPVAVIALGVSILANAFKGKDDDKEVKNDEEVKEVKEAPKDDKSDAE